MLDVVIQMVWGCFLHNSKVPLVHNGRQSYRGITTLDDQVAKPFSVCNKAPLFVWQQALVVARTIWHRKERISIVNCRGAWFSDVDEATVGS